MQRRYELLMAGLLGSVLAPWPAGPASAGCAGPSLTDTDRLVLVRGAEVTVEGQGFVDGCRDTMTCSGLPGCQSCEYDEPPEEPRSDVRLELRQHGRTWTLGTADAGTAQDQSTGAIAWAFEVPDGVRPGAARLVAEGARPVRIRVR